MLFTIKWPQHLCFSLHPCVAFQWPKLLAVTWEPCRIDCDSCQWMYLSSLLPPQLVGCQCVFFSVVLIIELELGWKISQIYCLLAEHHQLHVITSIGLHVSLREVWFSAGCPQAYQYMYISKIKWVVALLT